MPGQPSPMAGPMDTGEGIQESAPSNIASSGNRQNGDGRFIKGQSIERDKVRQATEAQFPAEFRELIKQYNINIKNTKPAESGPR